MELADRQARLQQLLAPLDQLPVSFWLSEGFESDYQIVFWNSGAERIYGYSKEEALGHSYLTLFVTDEQRDQSRLDAQRVIDIGIHPDNCIAIDRRKPSGSQEHGDEIILLTNVFRYTIGDVHYQAEIAVDLTPSGFLEFLDQEYRNERDDPHTHEEARQLYYFVRHARRQLEIQLELWGLTFSHSIRSELGQARDALANLRTDLQLAGVEENSNLRALQSATSRLLTLSDNFHIYHKPPTLLPQVEDDDFNLTGLINDIVEEYRYDAESEQLTIIQEDGRSVVLPGPRDAFEHAFRNLLANSIDHAQVGVSANAEIRISAVVEGDVVLVEVSNPGEIDNEVLSKSFSPFYAALGESNQRLHLGLYISNLWLSVLGGSLEISNDDGRVRAFMRWPLRHNRATWKLDLVRRTEKKR